MSGTPMSVSERRYRRLARYHGKAARTGIGVALAVAPSAAPLYEDVAAKFARDACHYAGLAQHARDRREGRR